MTASTEHGHKWSLHKVTEKPEHGFGYPSIRTEMQTREEVEARAADWNKTTAEGCPHASILSGAKCGHCGYKYMVTDL